MNKKRVIITRNGQSSTIYFANWAHHPPEDELKFLLQKSVYANKCSDADASQLSNGEISLHFNPLTHTRSKRRKLEREVKAFVEAYN